MAQRFGGRHSPENSRPSPAVAPPRRPNAWDGKRRSRVGSRSAALFFLPLIFIVKAFRGDPSQLVLGLGAAAALALAAWLTREGIHAEEAYDARRVAKRPAIPRKIFGSVLTGAGLFAGSLMGDAGLVYGAVIGLIGAGLHSLAFGLDPLTDKAAEGVDSFQTDRVARAVDEGEKHLLAMREAILRLGDRGLETRVERFAVTARTLFRGVESDPGDLTAARKYLGVYLMGARDATVQFADLYARNHDAGARAEYEALLTDLETNFASRTQLLLSNDRSDLDVEIGVLRERLLREH
ncbi:5-bromo-4-chloroindolyl phosphate hydrolysis family protein [Cereibacter changlensis]|uniref:5-bromo-4-chloroindolyl phosphate hydrolysis family protein n=1 Tax=Cereibacter changlensis TaxID=402884 RepID=UPI004033E31B